MKRITLFGSLMLAVFLLSGCFLKSVHPLITHKNATLITGLDGVFEIKDQRWSFASDKHPEKVAELIRQYPDEEVSIEPGEVDSLNLKGYIVLMEPLDDSLAKPVLFIGMAGEINGDVYLNLKLLDFSFGMNSSFVGSHTFNVNTFSKIKVTEEELVMEPFKSSWIRTQIENNRIRIKHEIVYSDMDDSSEILITASTKELRTFVEKYGKEEDAYDKPVTLKRVLDEEVK
jgi:hypothetical protein